MCVILKKKPPKIYHRNSQPELQNKLYQQEKTDNTMTKYKKDEQTLYIAENKFERRLRT